MLAALELDLSIWQQRLAEIENGEPTSLDEDILLCRSQIARLKVALKATNPLNALTLAKRQRESWLLMQAMLEEKDEKQLAGYCQKEIERLSLEIETLEAETR